VIAKHALSNSWFRSCNSASACAFREIRFLLVFKACKTAFTSLWSFVLLLILRFYRTMLHKERYSYGMSSVCRPNLDEFDYMGLEFLENNITVSEHWVFIFCRPPTSWI